MEQTDNMAYELAEMELNMMGVDELKALALDALQRKWQGRGAEAIQSAYTYMTEGYLK